MIKYLTFSLLVLSSCSSSDAKFCECLKAAETLNEHGKQFLNVESSNANPTKEDAKKFKELSSAKTEACADYTDIGGDELKKLQESCE